MNGTVSFHEGELIDRVVRSLVKLRTLKPPIHSHSAEPPLVTKTSSAKEADTLRLTRCGDWALGESGAIPF